MSFAFIPSLIGCMLLMFGVVSIVEEDNVSTGAVQLAAGCGVHGKLRLDDEARGAPLMVAIRGESG